MKLKDNERAWLLNRLKQDEDVKLFIKALGADDDQILKAYGNTVYASSLLLGHSVDEFIKQTKQVIRQHVEEAKEYIMTKVTKDLSMDNAEKQRDEGTRL